MSEDENRTLPAVVDRLTFDEQLGMLRARTLEPLAATYGNRVDVRDLGPLRPVAVALERINRWFWWNHNGYFHRWILRRAPTDPGPMTALDVGCGHGDLVGRLHGHGFEVIGIDPDPIVAEFAGSRFATNPTVTIERATFEEFHQPVDVITMVASLHHQPLTEALRHARDLLKPGGRLLIVGLAKPHTLVDLAYDVVSSALNPLVGVTKKVLGQGGRPSEMPMLDPTDSVDYIAAVARRELPGSLIRRRLFFRYTLEWTKPLASG